MKKEFRQKIRNWIVNAELNTIKWAYPEYECIQMVKDLQYYQDKLKEIKLMILISPRDRFLRDQEMECENRIWELTE